MKDVKGIPSFYSKDVHFDEVSHSLRLWGPHHVEDDMCHRKHKHGDQEDKEHFQKSKFDIFPFKFDIKFSSFSSTS